jgi:uncharacterized protein (DUF433 family)
VNYQERIVIDPQIRSGKPCIRGTRITVTDVFDYLGGGMTVSEVLDDFPDLTLADIQACFAFAANRDRRLAVLSSVDRQSDQTASSTNQIFEFHDV